MRIKLREKNFNGSSAYEEQKVLAGINSDYAEQFYPKTKHLVKNGKIYKGDSLQMVLGLFGKQRTINVEIPQLSTITTVESLIKKDGNYLINEAKPLDYFWYKSLGFDSLEDFEAYFQDKFPNNSAEIIGWL